MTNGERKTRESWSHRIRYTPIPFQVWFQNIWRRRLGLGGYTNLKFKLKRFHESTIPNSKPFFGSHGFCLPGILTHSIPIPFHFLFLNFCQNIESRTETLKLKWVGLGFCLGRLTTPDIRHLQKKLPSVKNVWERWMGRMVVVALVLYCFQPKTQLHSCLFDEIMFHFWEIKEESWANRQNHPFRWHFRHSSKCDFKFDSLISFILPFHHFRIPTFYSRRFPVFTMTNCWPRRSGKRVPGLVRSFFSLL